MVTEFGNLYLGNRMSGVPFFNAPWFDKNAEILRKIPGVTSVFNPAEHDREMGFEPMNCPEGSREEMRTAGFHPRYALGFDWSWIARQSSGLVIGPDWRESPGTISEIACHQALRLPVWSLAQFLCSWREDAIFSYAYTLSPLRHWL
jgi:hypothetical protein